MDRIINHLLRVGARLPGVDASVLQQLRESIIIIGDNVGDYFYEVNDQEFWDVATDFPNIAPPFEQFFLDFRAPSRVVSRATGVRVWPADWPCAWGLLCTGREQDSTHHLSQMDLSQKVQQDLFFAVYPRTLDQLRQKGLELGLDASAFEEQRLPSNPTPEQQQWMEGVELAKRIYHFARQGNWAKVQQHLSAIQRYYPGAKWVLNMKLFLEFRMDHLKKGRRALFPAWQWEIAVDQAGKVVMSGNEYLVRSEPIAKDELRQNHPDPSRSLAEEVARLENQVSPLAFTGLLTLSFLHCKNVSLDRKEDVPEREPQKHLTNAQRRRQKKQQQQLPRPTPSPEPAITYHVLNIEPMKTVLRTEGQAEKQGLKRALHICRGHFAHYEQGKGLFGKYHGTYWRASHVRGSAKRGTRVKDYRIANIPPEP